MPSAQLVVLPSKVTEMLGDKTWLEEIGHSKEKMSSEVYVPNIFCCTLLSSKP